MTTFAQPFQDYEILDRVGAGAMGTVFKARHKRLNRIVALKVLKPSLARDKRYVERLRREARIVASLSHPHIVTGYDLGEEGGYHFFVMEFVEGKSLRALLVEWGMFAEEYVLRVARQVAEALDHAYQRGVIHRDIKPGNILIDEAGNVKLTDMGLAKGPADLTLTRDGATVGTPQYISPEQARNPQDVDVRSDLYSLGATLYHMATGVPPFRGDTMAELITNVLHGNPVPPDEANSAVSAGVSLVIRKLLAKNLQVRYQTPRELLDDLDRIAKSEAPAVDAGRLAHDELEPAPWLKRTLLGVVAGALVVLAWWFGSQMRGDAPREPPAEQFLAALDAELQALPTPGARLMRLGTVTAPPSGSVLALEQRRKQVEAELQRAVDVVVEQLAVADWPRLSRWFVDPTEWPDRARFEREHLAPRLRAAAGITLGQLPARVRLVRVDELLRAVDAALSQRDRALQAGFVMFLTTTLPARADGRLRTGDFAGAERLWRDALPTYCDGVQRPLSEQLSDDMRRALRDAYAPALRAADESIDRAERNVAGALRAEVDAVLATFGERLAGGADPETVAEALRRFRHELGQLWPPPVQFRVAADPWPGVERRVTAMQQDLELTAAARQSQRCERRLDLAWRAVCIGSAGEALGIVEDTEPATAVQERQLAAHRRALAAARDVEQALAVAVSSAEPAPFAFPLVGPPDAIELNVQRQGDRLQLVGQAIGQPPRLLRWTELRLGDLLQPGSLGGTRSVLDVPPELRALGIAVLRLVADDLGGRDGHVAGLPAADRSFLLDDAWPRILRVRDARGEQPLDRSALFVMLERALADFDRHGSLTELEKAILACSKAAPAEPSARQIRQLRRAQQRLDEARRQRDLTAELQRNAPRGADVEVRAGDDGLTAEIALPAAVLQRDAGEGWRLRDELLEFAAAGRPWKDLPRLSLRGSAGVDVGPAHTQLTCELALPSALVGRRFYLVQFRGIACVLVVAADDRVAAALVGGDPLRDDRVQPAFERALAIAAAGESRALVVPGAVHRLTMDVVATAARTQARVRIAFEGVELLDELHELDPAAPPTFAVLPQQELAVRRITLRAVGM